MKIHLEIDTTPQELRSFFGLPDIEPLQKDLLEIIQHNMATGMEGFDPATLMKPFLPEQMQSLTALQKVFWQTMLGQNDKKNSDKKEKPL